MSQSIVILDFGSQYTQLIARRIRSLQVFSVILPYNATREDIELFHPSGLILSGGPSSVYGPHAPLPHSTIFDIGVPVLGICYGMQLLAHLGGGKIAPSPQREYGFAELEFVKSSPLFEGVPDGSQVWMSHGDKVGDLPEGFEMVARSDRAPAAMHNLVLKHFAVQFHPEVVHTVEGGKILSNFVFGICGAKATWTMPSFIEETIRRVRERVGEKKVVLGLSGGVDSTVLAVLLHRALGDRLICVFVDNGVLRLGEAKKVAETFQKHFKMKLHVADARQKFLKALRGVDHPEKKRKIIGKVFVKVFFKAMPKFDFLAQGTLYPDVIESVSTKGPSDTIKTHHNRVDQILKLKKAGRVLEPFEELFKDEVRLIGRELGLPDEIINRHPFPGPGLAIRVMGAVNEERLDILRRADAILIEEIKAAGLYEKIWQSFCVLLPVRTVGVMGDQRTYGQVVALRIVESVDGMTADYVVPPKSLITRITARIVGEIKEINRVVLDVTSKPPGTIEWE